MAKAKKKCHICPICDKILVQSNLNRHVKIVHEGIKNYQCQICEQKFSRSGKLQKHVKIIHEGIKDYQCHICVKKFGQLKHLKRHVKTVHVNEGVDQGMKMMEKHALDFSNINGFDHIEEPKIKKEIKTEVKIETIDEEIEKPALDFSNITGFDYENQTEEQKIKKEMKQEVKIEPMDENFNE